MPMLELSAVAVHDQHPRILPAREGIARDKLGRQRVVEIGGEEAHPFGAGLLAWPKTRVRLTLVAAWMMRSAQRRFNCQARLISQRNQTTKAIPIALSIPLF